MKQPELLTRLKESRARLEAALAGLTEAQFIMPGAMDDWTVKDLLAHLTAWEVELVTLVGRWQLGQSPNPLPDDDKTVARLNARWRAAYKDRPLDRVLADWRAVRQQTLRQVERLSDADLNAPRKWLKGETLADTIKSETFEHEAEHLAHLLDWREKNGLK
jgi:uncharacterized protein (TIGR03083 family)